ncbi:hypothetical protein AB1Y20_007003 [Prymnesium parvum]|uniref:Uncharacterized protein n=1 Tax=Prymnesium parvum TaxID=97485 RepID=A0AB34J2D1_PRYPA
MMSSQPRWGPGAMSDLMKEAHDGAMGHRIGRGDIQDALRKRSRRAPHGSKGCQSGALSSSPPPADASSRRPPAGREGEADPPRLLAISADDWEAFHFLSSVPPKARHVAAPAPAPPPPPPPRAEPPRPATTAPRSRSPPATASSQPHRRTASAGAPPALAPPRPATAAPAPPRPTTAAGAARRRGRGAAARAPAARQPFESVSRRLTIALEQRSCPRLMSPCLGVRERGGTPPPAVARGESEEVEMEIARSLSKLMATSSAPAPDVLCRVVRRLLSDQLSQQQAETSRKAGGARASMRKEEGGFPCMRGYASSRGYL